ncbi:MAG: Calcineurin-like phosphoesterase superfamily domain protein [Gemmatimonadetes bacterium]|nr:Calcineurin-like phosphoesterase superfamily domain protein [Gemmatimonadota bacterium]
MSTITVFHCSDLHFGSPAVPEQYEAMESLIQEYKYDVVAISGDLTQRARSGEFQRARAFIKHAEETSKVICIPGNHDVAWWKAPLGLGDTGRTSANYFRYISDNPEPVLQVPGATFAGLNTSHGVTMDTLTWRLRDISIIGIVTKPQIERLRKIFLDAPAGNTRVVVMHHNPVKGELSQRHGLKDTSRVLGAFADMGVDVVLCGHDHQDAIHFIEHTKKGTVISTAGTVSNRMRGGRPSSVNSIRLSADQIEVATLVWSVSDHSFVPGPTKCFKR